MKYPIETALRLWTGGFNSYLRRLETKPQDKLLYEVMQLMKGNLQKLMKERNITRIQELANLYSEDHTFDLYGGESEFRRYLDKPGNYVITSTFEDAAYYFIYEELINVA